MNILARTSSAWFAIAAVIVCDCKIELYIIAYTTPFERVADLKEIGSRGLWFIIREKITYVS